MEVVGHRSANLLAQFRSLLQGFGFLRTHNIMVCMMCVFR
jgi:hypothetical protein